MRKLLFILVIVGIIGFVIYTLQETIHQSSTQQSSATPTASPVTQISGSVKTSDPELAELRIPSDYVIHVFARGLNQPRDLQMTDQGTLLVSTPGNGEVVALPDRDQDGTADEIKPIITREDKPHGLSMYKGNLYVAAFHSIKRYTWNEQQLNAIFDKQLLTLPGEQNHTLRTLVFGKDGRMYISVGSNCNVCVEPNPWVGTVITANADGTNARVFAKGQRNAPFLAVNPTTGSIWATGMGRDYLGDNLPPDEINILKDTRDYGWPLCYGNKVHDTNFDKKHYLQDPCRSTEPPIYEIPAHSAPLGLTFIDSAQFPFDWQKDLFVAYHGSWNRSTPIGYKVVHLKVQGDSIVSSEDFLTGFSKSSRRPVDITFDSRGNMYLSDDKAGEVYIVSKK